MICGFCDEFKGVFFAGAGLVLKQLSAEGLARLELEFWVSKEARSENGVRI